MSHPTHIAGFQEVVVAVEDLDVTTETFHDAGGWVTLAEEDATPDLAAFWLAPGAAARQRVLANPGADRGFLRLVQFKGVAQRRVRDHAMAWDTGGFFDLYIPVANVDDTFEALRKRGWHGFAPFLQYDFGPITVREIIARGPEGIVLCLMQWITPPDMDRGIGRAPFGVPFNLAMTVPESGYAAAHAFFKETLGWGIYYEGVNHSAPPGDNPVGLPRSVSMAHDRRIAMFINHSSDRTGSLQIIGFDGLIGHDCAADAAPPHLGLFAARVPVGDVRATIDGIVSRGGKILTGPIETEIAPYGPSILAAIATPQGARIELFGPPV